MSDQPNNKALEDPKAPESFAQELERKGPAGKLKTHKFARKPFYVDAVRVTEENMARVAEWCGGEIKNDSQEGPYIKVKVYRPMVDRQAMAFLGDWVLFAGTGFKVYTPKAFDKSFEKVRTLSKEEADAAGIKVPHEPKKLSKKQADEKGIKVPREPSQSPRLAYSTSSAPAKKATPRVIPPRKKDAADKLLREVEGRQ